MYRSDLIFELTIMTVANSYALRPCPESTELILGVFGRALHNNPSIRIHALNPISSHITALISSDDPSQFRPFLNHLTTNISKELRKLHKLPYAVFSGQRSKVLPVSPDQASEEWRFRYCLSQGTKEDLVESPRHWPGVTGVHALERGEPLYGWWFDRTAEGKARRRRETFGKYDYATRYEIPLWPLPCWAGWSEKKWRGAVTDIVDDIASSAAARRGENKSVLGAEAVKRTDPRDTPEKVEKTRSPVVLAVTQDTYRALRRFYDRFCEMFWEQSRRLRDDPDADVEFPPFSYPPARPMTGGPALPLDLDFAFAPG